MYAAQSSHRDDVRSLSPISWHAAALVLCAVSPYCCGSNDWTWTIFEERVDRLPRVFSCRVLRYHMRSRFSSHNTPIKGEHSAPHFRIRVSLGHLEDTVLVVLEAANVSAMDQGYGIAIQ